MFFGFIWTLWIQPLRDEADYCLLSYSKRKTPFKPKTFPKIPFLFSILFLPSLLDYCVMLPLFARQRELVSFAFGVSRWLSWSVLLPTAPKVTPSNVSGGGGSRSELVITWEVSKLAQEAFHPCRRPPNVITLFEYGPVSLITREQPNVWHIIFKNTEAIAAAVTLGRGRGMVLRFQ